MIKLYGSGASRWVKPYWLLKELDVPFEPITVSIMKGDTRKPEYLALNPFAKVPALEDGNFRLYESLAITNYLGDVYGQGELVPKPATQERALFDQWMSFAVTELEQPLWRMTRHRFVYPEGKRSQAEIELAQEDFHKVCKTFESQLQGDYVTAGRFTAADVAITYTLKWATLPAVPEGMLKPFPKLTAYLAKHSARPAFPHELYPSPTKGV